MAKILLADDSATEIHVFTQYLEKNGHSVMVAKTGTQAVEMALHELPDLILMDIVMPEMDGYQATRKLRQHSSTAGIPVIIVSTKAQETDKIWGMRQGAKDYMVKPISESELIASINELLNVS